MLNLPTRFAFARSLIDPQPSMADDTPLLTHIVVCVRRSALDATPRAARELTCRNGRAVHDRRDLVEGRPTASTGAP